MTTRIMLGLMALGALIAAALYGIGAAHADPMDLDTQYLSLLDRDGITNGAGASSAIAGGHYICSLRMGGTTEADAIAMVYRVSQLSSVHSVAMVRDSEQVYCPGYLTGGSTV